jgi:CubicO group peptidase (beta-lactamase class C family)
VVASVSKPVTGTALMQLWERGAFGLHDDVGDYLPFEVRNPLYPDSAVTFHMLMSHTSSIDDNWDVLDSLVTWGGDSPVGLHEFLAGYLTPGGVYHSADSFNDWPPGDRYDYSNVGATLAGYLAETISGMPLATYCQDSLFAPLEMDATSWFLADLDSSRVAVPYWWNGSAHVRYPHWGTPIWPASQLRTTTTQLARYLAAFMGCGEVGGVRILDCPTVELMNSVQDPQINVNSGLLWYRMHYGGRFIWGHGGNYYGCTTQMFYCPDENTGAIVFANGHEFLAVIEVMHEVFEYAAASTAVHDPGPSPNARSRLTLLPNRPNPFNPTTTLVYELSRPDLVRLTVYDVLGRQVAILAEGRQRPGEHRVVWHASTVGAGIYFARLESGGEVRTIRMALVK